MYDQNMSYFIFCKGERVNKKGIKGCKKRLVRHLVSVRDIITDVTKLYSNDECQDDQIFVCFDNERSRPFQVSFFLS